jgi:hypothetical protein
MAFEWKLIGEDVNSDSTNASPAEQPIKTQPIEEMTNQASIAQSEGGLKGETGTTSVLSEEEQKLTPETASSPRCETHNSAVNSAEKTGYNGTYDSGVYSSYDTGVNSEENSVVA